MCAVNKKKEEANVVLYKRLEEGSAQHPKIGKK